MTVRTTPIGPSRPITSAAAPNAIVQAQRASKPRSSSESAAAAVAITSSSKTVQPRHWTTLIAVGRYEPRSPSGARISTIAGTRACAPIAPGTASIRIPTRQPTRIASSVPTRQPTVLVTSAVGSDSAGTSAAPATITSSETPRFPQRSPMSTPPSTWSRSGTGSIPQDVSRSVTSGEGTALERRLGLSPRRSSSGLREPAADPDEPVAFRAGDGALDRTDEQRVRPGRHLALDSAREPADRAGETRRAGRRLGRDSVPHADGRHHAGEVLGELLLSGGEEGQGAPPPPPQQLVQRRLPRDRETDERRLEREPDERPHRQPDAL